MNQRVRLILRPPALSGGARSTERMVEAEAAQGEVRLGRGADLHLTLPFPTVSTLHARIFALDEQWWVEDMGSVNGTWIGPRRISANRPEPLRPGDELRLADITVVFAGVAVDGADLLTSAKGEVHGTTTIARRLVADLFGAVRPTEVAVVEVVGGPDEGQRLPLPDNGRMYRLGRGGTCDLVLTDADVSREHTGFERRWDGIFVQDLGSKNGVHVAGKRITAPTRVGDGDEISFGSTRVRLDDPEDRYLRLMEAPSDVVAPAASAPTTFTRAPSQGRRVTRRTDPVLTPVGRSTVRMSRGGGGALWLALVAGGVLVALVGLLLVFVL
ncbi:MAG: FHA domain-containing protein [Deltaproteobacteria bacterium]|nr:FHA domain-containing protein [Deltaproteobacteria bacterium]